MQLFKYTVLELAVYVPPFRVNSLINCGLFHNVPDDRHTVTPIEEEIAFSTLKYYCIGSGKVLQASELALSRYWRSLNLAI